MSNLETQTNQFETFLQAIDFFSQRFHEEQLLEYGYKFLNMLFDLDKVALFIRDGEDFKVKEQTGYEINDFIIPGSKKLSDIPLFHGQILTRDKHKIKDFFDEEVIDALDLYLVVPMISDTTLVGFMAAGGEIKNRFSDSDFIAASSLMRLINTSLENNKRLLSSNDTNAELDKKIFNLSVINHSTRTILSELKIEDLCKMASEVFSETSYSKVTSFGVYSKFSNKVKMLGYRDVETFGDYYTEIELNDEEYDFKKIVLDVKEDSALIQRLFKNWEEFEALKAKYIILLGKGQIVGLVTIGESLKYEGYQQEDFELIESLAIAAYISIVNAQLFEEVEGSRDNIKKKFSSLVTLNELSRNLNSCDSKEELYELLLHTLNVGYGVNKAFICEPHEGGYRMITQIGIGEYHEAFDISPEVIEQAGTGIYYDVEADSVVSYISDFSLLSMLGETNGFALTPILKSAYSSDFLVVVDTNENLKDEEILIFDTMAKNVTPVVRHFESLAELTTNVGLANVSQLIKQELDKKIIEKEVMNFDFFVYLKRLGVSPFEVVEVDQVDAEVSEVDHIFVINNIVVAFSYVNAEYEDWIKLECPRSLEELEMAL